MRNPTRPERLAAARAHRRREAVEAPPALNPPYPYRCVPWTPEVFEARRCLVTRDP